MRPLAADMKGKNVSQHSGGRRRLRGLGKQLLAAVATLAMSIGLIVVGSATAANAALPSGITQAQIVMPGTTPPQVVQPGDELPQGQELQLRVSYDVNAAGSTVDFKLGPDATLGDLSGLAGNTEIASFELVDGDTVRVTFKEPFERTAGVFSLNFKIDDDAGPGTTTIGWEIGTEPVTVSVEIEDPNPPAPPVDLETGYNKSVYTTSSTVRALNNYVRFTTDPETGYDVYSHVDPSIMGQDITYTLRVTLGNDAGTHTVDVSDQLPAGLQYVNAGTAVGTGGTVTTTVSGQQYDAAGLNPAPISTTFAPVVGADGRSFSGDITLTGPAYADITYTVRVTDMAAINALMQTAWNDWNTTPGRTGTFTGQLTNTATFEGPGEPETRTATVNVNGTVSGPCVTGCSGNGGFAKANNWGDQQREFATDEDGNILLPASDIVYSFRADLGNFDGRNGNPLYTLDRNVVITDTLADQASWQASDAGFISVAEGSSPDFTTLTEFAGTCDASGIAGAAPGSYCVTGKTLHINVGQNPATDVLIEAKAQLDYLDTPLTTGDNAGLREFGTSTVQDATPYRFRNVATITYSDTRGPASMGTNIFPVKLPQDEEGTGYNDSAAFTKTGPGSTSPNAEGVAHMEYEFMVNTAKTGPIEEFHMVDHIDDRYFDLGDTLAPPTVQIHGVYDGVVLEQEDFALTLDSHGDLVIVLSASGLAKVEGTEPGELLTLTLTLQTRVIGPNETLDIVNRATLFGDDEVADYWDDDESMATSFGHEVGVQKRVWDQTEAEWVRSLRAPTNADGSLANTRYVYQIDFRSYDDFTDSALINVVDSLSGSLDFLSFVPSGDPADGLAMQPADYVDTLTIDTLTAQYNAHPAHEVRVTKPQGQWYPAGARISFLLLVEVNDDSNQIANSLTWNGGDVPGTETNIDGVSHPSIDIEKWIEEGEDTPEYGPDGALLNDKEYAGDYDKAPGKKLTADKVETIHFTVSNDGGDRLVDITVGDSLTSGFGAITDLVCEFPEGGDRTATWWEGPMEIGTQFPCTGTLPALKPGQTHADTATVTAWGEINRDVQVSDADDWHGHVEKEKKSGLSVTGAEGGSIAAMIGGAAVLLAGGALLMLRRRKAGV